MQVKKKSAKKKKKKKNKKKKKKKSINLFKFTTTRDRAGTEVFLTVGNGAKALGASACVGDFDGECEGDWAKVDIEENPNFNTPSCLQVSDFTLAI